MEDASQTRKWVWMDDHGREIRETRLPFSDKAHSPRPKKTCFLCKKLDKNVGTIYIFPYTSYLHTYCVFENFFVILN